MMHISRPLAALATALLLPVLFACHNGSSSTNSTTSGSSGSSGGSGGGFSSGPQLRVVDLALGAPYNFDVLDGTTSITTDLAYGQATAFQAVAAAGLTINFEPTGTTTTAFSASVATANGATYSVVAVEGTSALTTITVAQNNVSLNSGQAQITFVNASPAVSSLDLYVTAPGATLPATPSQSAIAYPGDAASITPTPLVVASGTVEIRAVSTGDFTKSVVYDSGPITLASGATPLLLITPVTGSASSFELASLGPTSAVTMVPDQRVQVRVGNFAPATATVDTYLDASGAVNSPTTLLASSIGADAFTGYKLVQPGDYRASFTASGQLTELIGSNLSLAPGTAVSIFAAGLPALTAPYNLSLLAFRDDLSAPASGMAKLRLVDLAPDIGSSVDLVALTSSNGVTAVGQRYVVNLPYAGASAYVNLPPGSYILAVVPTGATTPILPTSAGTTIGLSTGTLNTLVLAGCQFPNTASCPGSTAALQLVPLTD